MRLLAREDVAQLLELGWIVTPLTQVRFPAAARDFCPRVNFQCRLSYRVRTPPCAIACINICVHVKDPVVHVRVWWIMETLKHPACTIDLVDYGNTETPGMHDRLGSAALSQLAFPGESNSNFPLENS